MSWNWFKNRPLPLRPRKAVLQLESLEERVLLDASIGLNPSGPELWQEGQSVALTATYSGGTTDAVTWDAFLPDGLSIETLTTHSALISGILAYDNASNGLTLGFDAFISASPDPFEGWAVASISPSWDIADTNRLPSVSTQVNAEGDSVSLNMQATDNTGTDTLTYSASSLPEGLSINSSTGLVGGVIDYTNASVGETASFGVTVLVNDQNNATDTRTFEWDVSYTNRLASVSNQANSEGDSVSLALTATDNTSTDTVTYSGSSLPEGLSVDPSTGVVSGLINYDNTNDAPATNTASVFVADQNGDTDTQTFLWAVSNTNRLSVSDQSNSEGDTVSVAVTATDLTTTDVLAYTMSGLPGGLTYDSGSGLISGVINYANASDTPVTDIVSVTLNDQNGGTDLQTFAWVVSNTNRLPDLSEVNDVGQAVSVTYSATDLTGTDVLSYSVSNLPDGVSQDSVSGLFSGVVADSDAPSGGMSTYYPVETLTDDQGGVDMQTLTWVIGNPPFTFTWSQTWADNPTISAISGQTNVEGDAVYVSPTVSDDTGTALSFAAVGLPPGVSIDPSSGTMTGTVAYLDAEVFSGVYPVTVIVANADGGSASTNFNWTVTAAPPVLTNPGDQTNYIEDDVDLQVDATDTDGNWLTFSATGLPSGLDIDPDYGDIYGEIDDSALSASPYAVVVDVDDGMGNTLSTSFNWTVGIMNPAPSLTSPGDQVNAVGDVVDVFPDSSDAAGYTLTFAAAGLPDGLSVDPGSGEITGTLTATAATDSPYSVVLTASDGQLSDSQTFNWTISAISLTNPGDQTDLVGDTVSLALTGTDGGVGSLTFGATGLPAGLTLDATAGLISGVIGSGASDSTAMVTLSLTDGSASTTQILDWSVAQLALTDPAQQYNAEGGSVSLQLQGNDVGGTPTYTASGLPDGVSVNASTGLVTGTVALGAAADSPYQATVTLTDGADSDSESFVWAVSPEVSLLNPGDQSSAAGESVSIALTASSAAGTLSYSASGLPSGVSVNSSTGLLTGTLGSGTAQVDPYAVTLTVSDGTTSSSATFGWTVSALDLPTPADQENLDGDSVSLALAAHYNGTATLSYGISGLPAGLSANASTGLVTGTLANDADLGDYYFPYEVTETVTAGTLSASQSFAWDVEPRVGMEPIYDQTNVGGDTVSLAVSAGDATTGTLSYSASNLPTGLSENSSTGLITGTISSTAVSSSPFEVTQTVGDGSASVSESLAWTIAPLGLLNPGAVNAVENQAFSLNLQAWDADGGTLSYSISGLPSGLSVDSGSGILSGTPSGQGWYEVVATASEGSLCVSQTFILGVQEAGLTNPGNQTNTEGDTVSLQLQGASAAGAPLSYSSTALPADLSLDASAGTITGVIAAGAAVNGPYVVTVAASDGTAVGQEQFTWTVNPYVNLTSIANQSSTEGASVSLSVTASDVSGALSYSAMDLPSGLSVNASTGEVSGTVASGDALNGPYTVTLTAAYGGYSSSESFLWTVIPATAPAAPGVTNPGFQANQTEDPVSVQVHASDTAGYPLTFGATNLPDGLSIDPSAGLISGTIADDAVSNTAYPVTVTATDGVGETTSVTFPWAVAALNFDPPDDQYDVDGDSVSLQLSASDGLGQPVFSATGLPAGVSLNSSTGFISGTIGMSADGGSPYQVYVMASFAGASDVETFVWTVQSEIGLLNPGTQVSAPGDSVSLALTSESALGTVSFSATGLPSGVSVNASTGLITGTVDSGAAQETPYAATVTASHGSAQTSEVFLWTVAELALPATGMQFNLDGDSVSLALAAHYNGTATLSYSISGLPAGLSANASTGLVSGTLANDADVSDAAAPYEVTETATAGTLSAAQTFMWDVEPRVSMDAIEDQSNVGGDSVSLAVSADEFSSGTLTYSVSNLPAGLSENSSTGLITGTVASAAIGSSPYSVTQTVGDGSASVNEIFNWTVAQVGMVNPVSVFSVQGQSFSLSLQGRSADGGTLSFSATGLPSGMSLDSGTGDITGIAPTLGAYLVVATVSESGASASETLMWQVQEAGLLPVSDLTSTEGATISLALQGASGSGGTLTYSASNLPDGLSLNPTMGVVTGTLIPGAAADGPYAVTVEVDDGANSGSQTFNWTVNPFVSLATITPGPSVEGASVSLAVTATDVGILALSYSAVGLPDGLSENASTGLISGTVAAGAARDAQGNATVTVTATDGTYSSSETFTWALTPSTAPAAPSVTTLGMQPNQTGDQANLQIVASDAAGYTLNYTASNLPDGLDIDPSLGLISGTVADDAVGSYNVTVAVDDGVGETTSVTFPWIVNPSPIGVQVAGVSATSGTAFGATTVATFTTPDLNSDESDFTAEVYWGDGSVDEATVSGQNGVFTVATTDDHTYEGPGSLSLTMTVMVTDDVTGGVGTGTGTANVAVAPWTLTPFEEGVMVGQTGELLFTIQDDDPGVTASAFSAGSFGVTALGDGLYTITQPNAYTSTGEQTVTQTVSGPGGTTYTATSTVEVANLYAGVLSNLTVAQFATSDTSLTAGDYTATIDWGDPGSSPTTGTVNVSGGVVTVSGSYTYGVDSIDAPGHMYTVTVNVTDTAGDSFTASQGVVVVRPPITLNVSNVVADSTGTVSNQAVAVFHEPDMSDAASEFTATISWGDGTTSAGTVIGSNGLFQVDGSHTYTSPGDHFIQVIVSQGWEDMTCAAPKANPEYQEVADKPAIPTVAAPTIQKLTMKDYAADFKKGVNIHDPIKVNGKDYAITADDVKTAGDKYYYYQNKVVGNESVVGFVWAYRIKVPQKLKPFNGTVMQVVNITITLKDKDGIAIATYKKGVIEGFYIKDGTSLGVDNHIALKAWTSKFLQLVQATSVTITFTTTMGVGVYKDPAKGEQSLSEAKDFQLWVESKTALIGKSDISKYVKWIGPQTTQIETATFTLDGKSPPKVKLP